MSGTQTITTAIHAALRLIPAGRETRKGLYDASTREQNGDDLATAERHRLSAEFVEKVKAYSVAHAATQSVIDDFTAAALIFQGEQPKALPAPDGIAALALTIGKDTQLADLCADAAKRGAAALSEAEHMRGQADLEVRPTETLAAMLEALAANDFDRDADDVYRARVKFHEATNHRRKQTGRNRRTRRKDGLS
ncbi:hypothetical protein [Shimia sp. MIT1388]|uniref:hypothetical protein n=1 Tax=Shimia sp. MIT1388 TaxID=3096992 RepID=UPI00399B4CE2